MNGTTTYITYTGGTMVDKAFVEKNEMQYLYAEQTTIVLMDTTSFEQIEIPLANVKDELPFLIGGSNIMVTTFEGQVLGVELDKNVTLTVSEAPDAVQGNTVTNALKKITLETGLEIDAPQFIKPGDKIVVTTTDRKYVGKA